MAKSQKADESSYMLATGTLDNALNVFWVSLFNTEVPII